MKYKPLYLLIFYIVCHELYAQESLNLSIDEALEYARTHNYDKQMARFDMEIAEKKVKETIGIGLPQINGTGNYTNNIELPRMVFQGQTIQIGQKHNATGGLGLNQLIFDGSYIVGVQATRAYQKISELSTLKTDEALTEAVLQIYSSIIVSQETLKIYQQNKEILDKNLNDVTQIYLVGLGEEQTVEQMTFNRNQMVNGIMNTQNIIKTLFQNFMYILNVEEGIEVNLTTTFEEISEQAADLIDESELQALDNHIDMRIARNQTLTDKLQLKYEKSKYLPNLSGFISTEYNAFSDSFDLFKQRWYNTTLWGLSLNVPIFSGLQRKARQQQAEFQLEKSQTNERRVKSLLEKNAKESYLNFQNALLQFDLAQQQVELSQSIFNKENIKFFEGLGSSLDLTQAENQVFQAQAQLIQATSQVVTHKIALDKALGKFNLSL